MSNLRYISLFAVILVMVLFGFSSNVESQYLTIWADPQQDYCEVFTGSPYQSYYTYVFLHPDDDGAISAEYKMVGPEGHIFQLITPSPVVSDATTGVWYGSPGINVVFTSCQTTEFLIASFLMIAPTTTPGAHWIYPHDDTSFRGFVSCSEPSTLIDAFAFCLTFNAPCHDCADFFVPTSETSWGAIKNLYR